MKKILCIVAVLAFVLSACSKYEEGPSLSLRTKKARLINDWKQVFYSVNGVEVALVEDDKDDTWKFLKDGKYEFEDPGSTTEKGTWSFDDKKERVTLTDESGLAFQVKILRLTNNEFWFMTDFGGDMDEYHLEGR